MKHSRKSRKAAAKAPVAADPSTANLDHSDDTPNAAQADLDDARADIADARADLDNVDADLDDADTSADADADAVDDDKLDASDGALEGDEAELDEDETVDIPDDHPVPKNAYAGALRPGAPNPEDVLADSYDEIPADEPIDEAARFEAEDTEGLDETVHQANAYTNIWGIIGFVVSIVAICSGWFYFLGWIPWAVGLVISFIAVFRPPRAFAIAGLSISGAYFIIWMILLGLGL